MAQPEGEGFAGMEARIAEQRQKVPLVAHYLLHGGDEDMARDIAAHVATDAELLNKGLEAAGGLMEDGIVRRMGTVLRGARAINGLADEPQPRQAAPYRRSDETAFREARNNQARRA